jgi:hypothetical protein
VSCFAASHANDFGPHEIFTRQMPDGIVGPNEREQWRAARAAEADGRKVVGIDVRRMTALGQTEKNSIGAYFFRRYLPKSAPQ